MIDHKTILNMIFSGSKKVIENKHELNSINVFPVPDGDTGSNLSFLMKTILQETSVLDDRDQAMLSLKKAALRGARGNSGMIFSQFFIHFANGLTKKKSLSLPDFIQVCEIATDKTYESVRNPAPGTILSVMKDWVDELKLSLDGQATVHSLLKSSMNSVYLSLEKTKMQMEKFSGRKVVDSGAMGFVLFLEGVLNYKESHTDYVLSNNEISIDQPHVLHWLDTFSYRYCTEVMVENISNPEIISSIPVHLGDSVVVSGDESLKKIHIHTNQPHLVVEYLSDAGTVTYQKVDDMVRQFESIHEKKSSIALVIDSACDLPADFIDHHQIYVLPATIEIEDRTYLDKLTIQPEQFYQQLDGLKGVPKTSQPGFESIIRLYEQLHLQYDHILSIHVSKELSGTYESCKLAAAQVNPEKITVLNSKTLSGAYGLLIQEIADSIENGQSFEEILKRYDQLCRQTEILVSVPTIRHMIRGGRVTPLQGKIASLLKMLPIVSVDIEGRSKLYGKTFFRKSNLQKMFNMIGKIQRDLGIHKYVILHANDQEKADLCEKQMYMLTGQKSEYISNVSPVIGAHAGKGSVSVAMLLDKQKK